MKINVGDLKFNIYGFSCEKIKKMSDKKLMELEDELSEKIYTVHWVNIDDMNYLSVSWSLIQDISEKEKNIIVEILNNIILNKNKE